jgi:hypothetical protein
MTDKLLCTDTYCSAHALVDTNIQVQQHAQAVDSGSGSTTLLSGQYMLMLSIHTDDLRDSTDCCRTDKSRAAQYVVEQTRPETAKASVGQKLYRRLCSFAVYSSHPVRNIILETLTGIQNGSTVRLTVSIRLFYGTWESGSLSVGTYE